MMRQLRRLLIRLGLKKPKPPRFSSDPHIRIGRYSYLGPTADILCTSADGPVEIGNFCSIAEGVFILGACNHPMDTVSTFPFGDVYSFAKPYRGIGKGPTRIGHDVWIGVSAVVLTGVTVGNGAIIGAGAVVTKDVPPYAVVVGNPAKVLRYRFSQSVIDALQQIEWWHWPDSKIEAEIGLLESGAGDFVTRHAPIKTA